jgi:predicted dehydrogenase
MTNPIHRRRFLETTAAAVLAAGAVRTARADDPAPNEAIVVAVMGTGSRGTEHSRNFAGMKGCRVAYVCDVDSRRAGAAAEEVASIAGKKPEAVTDFRRILDDQSVDALVVATCNHWHAPAAILACEAGKHVYVEKPCSHNPREGELTVEAARKNDRVVQMGNQRRSWPKVIEAVQRIRSGDIGRPYFARSFYNNNRPSIGRGHETAPPEGLDYALWEGPAPHKPFHDNYLHYNWHWFWHWGNGELGNNGIHNVDVCRWAFDVDHPTRVTSAGGRYRYDDDQETPDTQVVTFEFEGDKMITWEGLSCNGFRPGGDSDEMVFTGEEGSLGITGGGYTIYDLNGKVKEKVEGRGGDAEHLANFVAAIKGEAKPNSPIVEGHRSTLLCHLGNIAQRTGRALTCDPKDGRILHDDEAMAYWTREYAPGWEPKV